MDKSDDASRRTGQKLFHAAQEFMDVVVDKGRMKTFFMVLLSLVGTVHAQELKWKTYTNHRFGFSVEYPQELVASAEAGNHAGREFHTENKEFSLSAQAHFLGVVDEKESLETVWRATLKELGKTVGYKRKAKDWFVVSGVNKAGIEYYYRYAVKHRNWAEIRITYPHFKNSKYDPWVERISKSFVPFLEGDFDRIDESSE